MKRKAVLYVDGGICSQICFYALGLFLEQNNYDVKYDLRWFRRHGKDMDDKFDRSFAIDKAFPKLKCKIASRFTVWVYRHFFKKDFDGTDIPKHLYVGGYNDLREKCFLKYKDFFAKNFNPIDLFIFKDLLKEIKEQKSCAIHVRRGDLSRYNPYYGMPPTPEYFIKAINYVLKQRPGTKFFFFSDEMDYVKRHIIPKLDKKIKYKICDKNGSDKGYLDLYLISRADSIIASHGSFGKTARDLSDNPDLLFVSTETINA